MKPFDRLTALSKAERWTGRAVLLAVLSACVAAGVWGCASEAAALRNSTDAYATTLNVLAECRRAGLIDQAEAARIEQWRIAARAALDAWDAALATGGLTDGPRAAFDRALLGLEAALTTPRSAYSVPQGGTTKAGSSLRSTRLKTGEGGGDSGG